MVSAEVRKEKLDEVVGCPLSSEQRARLRRFIEKYCPGKAEGQVLRISYLFLEIEMERRGPLCIIGRLMGE